MKKTLLIMLLTVICLFSVFAGGSSPPPDPTWGDWTSDFGTITRYNYTASTSLRLNVSSYNSGQFGVKAQVSDVWHYGGLTSSEYQTFTQKTGWHWVYDSGSYNIYDNWNRGKVSNTNFNDYCYGELVGNWRMAPK